MPANELPAAAVQQVKESTMDKINQAATRTEEGKTKEDKKKEDKKKDIKSVPVFFPSEAEMKCEKVPNEDDDLTQEEQQKELEDRKRVREETERHRMKMAKAIAALVGVEAVLCSMLLAASSNGPTLGDDHYMLSRFTNFRNDTLDLTVLTVIRLLVVYFLVSRAVVHGDVKNYDIEQEKHTLLDHEAPLYKLAQKVLGTVMKWIMQAWDLLTSLNKYKEDSQRSAVLLPPRASEPLMQEEKDQKRKIQKLFDLKELINMHFGMEANDVADFWKDVLWMATFFFTTVSTTIVGVKISFWNGPDELFWRFIAMFVVHILLTHCQSYFIKKYIDYSCKPDNVYFEEKIHQHPVFKLAAKQASCSICYERPNKNTGKRVMILKCSQCPAHRAYICLKCWNKKKKMIKQIKEGQGNEEELNFRDISFYEYFTTLTAYHLPYIHLLVLGVTLLGLQTVLNVFVPRQKGQLIDYLIASDMDGFYYAIKIQILFSVGTQIIGSLSSQSLNRVSRQISCDLQKRIFANLMFQDMVFYDDHSTNEISERMRWGLQEMLQPYQGSIHALFNVISCAGSLWMCLNISWRLTVVGMATLGPMTYFMRIFLQRSYQSWNMTWALQNEMYNLSHLAFQYIRTIRSFAKEREFADYFCALRQEIHNNESRQQAKGSFNQVINGWFRTFTQVLLSFVAGMIILYRSTSSALTVGLFVTFETYWNQFFNTMNGLKNNLSMFDHALFMAQKIFKTLEKKPHIECIECTDTTHQHHDIDGDISFEDVDFCYESSPDKFVLRKLNLTIEKGKTTALVGRSGGGKSTIMHLILRFYDPTKGVIKVNGKDLKEFNPYSLRRQIALVSQDTELFGQKSVKYNIGFGGHRLASEDEKKKSRAEQVWESSYCLHDVEHSAVLANAHKFISEMDDQYDSQMGTRGKRISGGQKQRISIARMLMSKPAVMLLDEATSSLDAESEALVQAAMERESEVNDCTLVIVAHRLSTVVNADKICVVEDGHIVEQGTHDELVADQGIYASLVERQLNLKSKMRQKLDRIKNGQLGNGDGKEEEQDDFDNIDKLIDQIKADKQTKESAEANEDEKQNGNESGKGKAVSVDHVDHAGSGGSDDASKQP